MIEIKCPYFARDMKIEEAILTPNFCLMKVGEPECEIKGNPLINILIHVLPQVD
jgi:hypothetical protein